MAPVILTWHLSQFDMAFAPNKPLSQVSSHHLAENHMSLLEEVQCGPKLAQTGILAAFTLRSSTGLFLRQTLIFAFGCLQSDAHLFIGAASNLCSMLLSSPPTHTHTPLFISERDSREVLEGKEQSIIWIKLRCDSSHRLLDSGQKTISLSWFTTIT